MKSYNLKQKMGILIVALFIIFNASAHATTGCPPSCETYKRVLQDLWCSYIECIEEGGDCSNYLDDLNGVQQHCFRWRGEDSLCCYFSVDSGACDDNEDDQSGIPMEGLIEGNACYESSEQTL